MWEMRNGRPVIRESDKAERRICPPPSPSVPSRRTCSLAAIDSGIGAASPRLTRGLLRLQRIVWLRLFRRRSFGVRNLFGLILRGPRFVACPLHAAVRWAQLPCKLSGGFIQQLGHRVSKEL